MPATDAQIRANRANASKSTGPKTPEGKAVSRFNAVTHGMTARSLTLPGEDSAFNEKRFVNLHAELRPSSELAEELVDEIASSTIRLRRCRRFDTAHYSDRVRHARDDFDDDRKTLVAGLGARLGHEAGVARKLQAMPEGVDWLLTQWEELRNDLDRPAGPLWGLKHLDRARDLRDIAPSKVRAGRELVLNEMVRDYFGNASTIDTPDGLDDEAKAEWARVELLKIVDAEIARLHEAREAFDPAYLEKQREESVDRVLFDPSKEMTLARKYEAAILRNLHKTIQQFRDLEAAGPPAVEDDAIPTAEETSEESGSISNPDESASNPDVDASNSTDTTGQMGVEEVREMPETPSFQAQPVPIRPS